MHYSTICLRLAAMLCGGALIASQVIQNLEHMGWASAYSGLGLAAIAVPVAMAVAVPVMQHTWTDRARVSTIAALLVLLCGIAHSTVVALERGILFRDVQIAANSSMPHDLAKKALADADKRVKALEARVLEEGRTGCLRACEAAKASLEDARKQHSERQAALVKVGAPVDQDGMRKRYGYLAQLIDQYHPAMLPLATELGGWVLIGYAFHRRKDAPQVHKEGFAGPLVEHSTKVEEAAEAIRRLRAIDGGKLGSVRVVSRRIGYSHGTTQRALKLADT